MMTEDEWDVALQVARGFSEYRSYGGSPKKAVKALTKRCPNLTIEDAQAAFDICLALLTTAIDIVDRRKDDIWTTYNAGDQNAFVIAIPELKAAHPGLPDVLYRWVTGWVWFWHHLK